MRQSSARLLFTVFMWGRAARAGYINVPQLRSSLQKASQIGSVGVSAVAIVPSL